MAFRSSSDLLPYENEVFERLVKEDALLIYAKGLGLHRILRQLFSVYCSRKVLVLVLGVSAEERKYYVEDLAYSGIECLPRVITNETPANEREELYLDGGVLFITPRILIVDMLKKLVPIKKITGFIVPNAHKITEKSTETFILRLFRQENKVGFVKGVSDYPDTFARGFATVQHIMKLLYLNKLHIRPRFFASIKDFLSLREPEVIELRIKLTEAMLTIQQSLLELIDVCIMELRRLNQSLHIETSSIDDGMLNSIYFRIRNQLKGVWHKTSNKTKSLTEDIKTLTNLIQYLTKYDCVTFYHYLESLKAAASSGNSHMAAQYGVNQMNWLMLDPTDTLFQQARSRIYEIDESKAVKTEKLVLEENPKWSLLSEVLMEIETDCLLDPGLNGNILVFGANVNTCNQLNEYLCMGGRKMLLRCYSRYTKSKNRLKTMDAEVSTTIEVNGKRINKGSHMTRRQKRRKKNVQIEESVLAMEAEPEMLDHEEAMEQDFNLKDYDEKTFNDNLHVIPKPNIIIQSIDALRSSQETERLLNDLRPKFVVCYNGDLYVTRQLEIYKATNPDQPLRIYFLFHEPSAEEQSYLTVIKKEKDALGTIIREKAIMAISESQDGRSGSIDENPQQVTNSRRAGREMKKAKEQRVIVDVREFRSELPSLLNSKGINVEPVTLEVGDYILSPEICVERKSISDLTQSLASGRLYNQCVAMSNTYAVPVLLIEFDEGKQFSLQSKYDFNGEINFNHIISKLTLLTIHFPTLRILWCSSPQGSADLIEKLKATFRQPNKEMAMSIGVEGPKKDDNVYNWTAQSLLRALPGITDNNIYYVMNRVKNVKELSEMSLEDIKILVGNSGGKQLYAFLHEVNQEEQKKS